MHLLHIADIGLQSVLVTKVSYLQKGVGGACCAGQVTSDGANTAWWPAPVVEGTMLLNSQLQEGRAAPAHSDHGSLTCQPWRK